MTRDTEQATADLRPAVRRLVEGASAEQLEAMCEAWGSAGPDLFAEDVLVLRPDAPWWENHSSACGVEYRGCAPGCPKDQHERAVEAMRLVDAGLARFGFEGARKDQAPRGEAEGSVARRSFRGSAGLEPEGPGWVPDCGPFHDDPSAPGTAAVSHEPAEQSVPPALTPGQRVTIPARYCGEGCHGVRVGTVAAFCVPGEVADVDVPGHGFLCVPIKEIQT
jgi:hypothetical protein